MDPTGAVADDRPLAEPTLRKTEAKISPSIKGVMPATGRNRDESLRTWNRQENLFRVTLGINSAKVNNENGFQRYLSEFTRPFLKAPFSCPGSARSCTGNLGHKRSNWFYSTVLSDTSADVVVTSAQIVLDYD